MATKDSAKLCRMSEEEARTFLEGIRWPSGACCSHCGSVNVKRLEGKATRPGVFKCRERECRKQFTVTTGTIFHGSHIALRDWVYAFARMCASKKGVSALQLQRELGVQYRTAWFLCHRIRHAMECEPLKGLLQGVVEVDEAYVGGKPRYPGKQSRPQWAQKRPEHHAIVRKPKAPVIALVERGGRIQVRAMVNVTAENLREELTKKIDPTAILMTDESLLYRKVGPEFAGHKTVKHSDREYYRHSDGAGINEAESFFAILKRGVYGTFHNVSKEHLQRYCNEFAFRWNYRDVTDRERTEQAIRQGDGKRLAYNAPASRKDFNA